MRAARAFWRTNVVGLVWSLAVTGSCEQPTDRVVDVPPRLTQTDLSDVAPQLSDQLARAARSDGWRATPSGFVAHGSTASGSFRPLAPPLAMELPLFADEPTRIELGTELLMVRRLRSQHVRGALHDGVLSYQQSEGVSSFIFESGTALEELLSVESASERAGYAFELPEGWSLAAEDDTSVTVRDPQLERRLSVQAPRAWELDGDLVSVRLSVVGHELLVEVVNPDIVEFPVVIDPTWSVAAVPIKLRQDHTATLLSDGRVLLVGGSTSGGADGSTELYDPRTGRAELGPSLGTGRARHTATPLLDGRVLILGGFDGNANLATADIFDPTTGVVSSTTSMNLGRASHTATLLSDGRVLVVGNALLSCSNQRAKASPNLEPARLRVMRPLRRRMAACCSWV